MSKNVFKLFHFCYELNLHIHYGQGFFSEKKPQLICEIGIEFPYST